MIIHFCTLFYLLVFIRKICENIGMAVGKGCKLEWVQLDPKQMGNVPLYDIYYGKIMTINYLEKKF